jgi:glycosyltransferase involved in cell wall biosynthesis
LIGIFVPEFPGETHIFFWREVCALRELNGPVCLLSTRRPEPASCRHEFAENARRDTHYVFPPRWGRALLTLASRPFGAFKAIRYVLGLRETPLPKRFAHLGLIVCAADLTAYSKERAIDFIHVHSCAMSAHVVALCRILGGPPYSLTLHGDLPVYGTDHASKMQGAEFIATDGPHLVAQVVEHGKVSPDRVMPTFIGLDLERFRAIGRRTFTPGRLHVVTVARLTLGKGHRHALRAVRQAVDQGCDLRYSIAGSGPDRAEIEAEIETLGLADRVTLLGTCTEAEVVGLLQEADVFVLASVGIGEAWPNAVMEAMACGLPVICSIIGGTTHMITNGVDGLLIEQRDERGLAEAIIRVAEDPSERQRLGDAARRRAVETLDLRRSVQRLLDEIQKHLPQTANRGTGSFQTAHALGKVSG